jgi:hypothetical protein
LPEQRDRRNPDKQQNTTLPESKGELK